MERIQLYPPANLKEEMLREAEIRGCSLSQLAVDILMEHYGLISDSSDKKPLTEITEKVLKEIELFVNSNSPGTMFDLLKASKTFENIHMVADGKPSTNRATVGKVFGSKVGMGVFEKVQVVRTASGGVKKSINGATVYKICNNPIKN